MSLLESRLAELETMSPAQLRAAVARELAQAGTGLRTRSPAPRHRLEASVARSRCPSVGYEEKPGGGRRAPARRRADQPVTVITLKPGTRLVAKWHGKPIRCSCSKMATSIRAALHEPHPDRFGITGTHWSGPAFFGLKKRHQVQRDRAAS